MKSLANRSSLVFYCFTPLVSLATFIIEVLLAVYVFIKYKTTLFSQLCIALFLCLGIFQLSEYFICTSSQVNVWLKVGYVAIALLPAFGIHITSIITKRDKTLAYSAYGLAGLFIFAVLFIPQIQLEATCEPHYVSISKHPLFGFLFGSYYAAYVLSAVYTLWRSMKARIGDRREEQWLIISYAVFVVPSIVLFYIKSIVLSALPSVMCGFAILTALIFVFFIIPRHYRNGPKKK